MPVETKIPPSADTISLSELLRRASSLHHADEKARDWRVGNRAALLAMVPEEWANAKRRFDIGGH